MWSAIFVAGIPIYLASNPEGWATCVSPLFTFFILTCFSGIPTAEGKASARWYDGGEAQARYEEYFDSTPPLWPFPPSLYRRMPTVLKRLLCFELKMYAYSAELATQEKQSQASQRAIVAIDTVGSVA